MDSPAERARAQSYWRRQLQLSCAAAVAFVLTLGVTRLVGAPWGRDPDNRVLVWVVVGMSGLVVTAVLALLLMHAFRVVAFTFRRGDNEPLTRSH